MNRKKLLLSITGILLLGAAIVAGALVAQGDLPQELQQKLDQTRNNLDEVKNELPQMACCLEPSCNFCPLAAGKCPCGANVKTEVGVCGECYDGWRAGHGHVPGVEPSEVQRLNQEMVNQMYQMKAQHFGESEHEH